MQLSELVAKEINGITLASFEKHEKRASIAVKFRFEKSWWSDEQTCEVCGKRTNRYGFVRNVTVCSSCARKISRAIMVSITMKRVRSKEYSRGVGYGYKLATTAGFGEETKTFLSMIIDDAKKDGKTVHFLGRDMDIIFQVFNLEDNVNYFAGWNREFISQSSVLKRRLLARNGVEEGDYFVDTGFVGSILDDISDFVDIKGYLLSAGGYKYPHLHGGNDYQYRDWVCDLEHIDRARVVKYSDETLLPEEVYAKPSWYENGLFHGFYVGMNK